MLNVANTARHFRKSLHAFNNPTGLIHYGSKPDKQEFAKEKARLVTGIGKVPLIN
jgi:hypothetical protein